MGYRLLPGTQASETHLPASAQARAARDLGRFLTALHGVALEQVVKLGFSASADEDHAAALLNEARRLSERIGPHLPSELQEAARPILEGRIKPPPPYGGPWRLIHNDLQAEHILLSSGAVAGVIDFGDAAAGDPAVDFVGFYAWQGPAFVRDVLSSYHLSTDALFWQRVSFMGRCLGLIGVGWVDKADPPRLATHLRFLRNAFAQS
jgi:aminoglycoside phosphotransferase (APT) family kinase protein